MNDDEEKVEETYRRRVQEDIEEGVAADVTGVLTTFLWDHETDKIYRVDSAQSIGTFRTLIRHILETETENNYGNRSNLLL